jgi:hypothetical protein
MNQHAMSRREFFTQVTACGMAAGYASLATSCRTSEQVPPALSAAQMTCEVCVYGSTPGGVAAALQAARRGCKVVLACPKNHPGGMAASGLCTTDAVRHQMFGGLVIEFIQRVRGIYGRTIGTNSREWPLIHDGWYYAPSVAELDFQELLDAESALIDYRKRHHLLAARVAHGRITEIELEDAKGDRVQIAARTFIDGTYEGDLAAAAGVPYRVGREGREEYGEPFAGIHYMNFRTGQQIITPDTGEPSPAIQAYCARCVFTVDPAHRLPIPKPVTYEQHLPDFEPLLGDFASGRLERWVGGVPLPGSKREYNGNIEAHTSLNCPGVSWAWPEAGRNHRARLEQFHLDHAAGIFWFLQNDSRVPAAIRKQVEALGLDRREFSDTGHLPWQIYVRQGRRIEGRDRLTQHNFTVNPKTGRTPGVKQAIALAEHSFDVHPCHDRRYAVEGFMEGVLWYPQKAFGPAQPGQVPYGAMLPKQLNNLLVPVALSSTHIAMSVLRMEPVWMTTGQIAGLAAAVAKDKRLDVANLDPSPLPKMLGIRTDPYA